jgi:hypothetical protein
MVSPSTAMARLSTSSSPGVSLPIYRSLLPLYIRLHFVNDAIYTSHMFATHYTAMYCTEKKTLLIIISLKNLLINLLLNLLLLLKKSFEITLFAISFVSLLIYRRLTFAPAEATTSIVDSQPQDACQICSLMMCSTYSAIHNFTCMYIQLIHTFNFPLNFDFFNSIQEEKKRC